jgi:hypothetical protein
MKNTSTYPLRLPRSVKAEVERRAREDGISVNQFVATAVAEKLAAMNTATFFAERPPCGVLGRPLNKLHQKPHANHPRVAKANA